MLYNTVDTDKDGKLSLCELQDFMDAADREKKEIAVGNGIFHCL
jgi:hypothetical protein